MLLNLLTITYWRKLDNENDEKNNNKSAFKRNKNLNNSTKQFNCIFPPVFSSNLQKYTRIESRFNLKTD